MAKKKLSFSERLTCIVLAICLILVLLIIILGWLVLDRQDAAYMISPIFVFAGSAFVIFEKKEEAQNKIKLAKLERKDLHEYQSQINEEVERECLDQSENMSL